MQALMLRSRLDVLCGAVPELPVIVFGDMNDGPGFDAYEKAIGRSFVETVIGSVYYPDTIYANALTWMQEENSADLWTAEFSDSIVSHPRNWKHRVWIDHILLSPSFRSSAALLTLVPGSGEPFDAARRV
jgi:endonuclease/exonuclease/phosphatase family metal-dependent hydrolase